MEAFAIAEDLNSDGPLGQNPAGINTPLIDLKGMFFVIIIITRPGYIVIFIFLLT